jgi:hypothetical protein
MKKMTVTSLIASALMAGLVGAASPAQADAGWVHVVNQPNFGWVNTISQPHVYVPHVDTTVHH